MNIYYFEFIFFAISALISLISILGLICKLDFYFNYFKLLFFKKVVKNHPEKCPSFSQIELRNKLKTNMTNNFKENFVNSCLSISKIWSKPSYILVAVSHAFLLGSIYSVTFLLNQILYANYLQVIY